MLPILCNGFVVKFFVMDPVMGKNTTLEKNRFFELFGVFAPQHLFITRGDNIETSSTQNIRDQNRYILIQVEGSEEFQRLTAGCTK